MRTAFIQELIQQARLHPEIFLVVGDLGFSVVEPFVQEFPDRFLNAGVAEQNMTGVAAGLASEGHHVFTYSIGNFPTFRCAEQVRNDIAYHALPVTVVAVGGGLSYGNLGYSHHAVQDIALMRALPNMMLACPGDPAETRACVGYLAAHPQPSYLRLGKAGEPVVHEAKVEVAPGRLIPVITNPGARCAILTTGATLKLAVSAVTEHWDVYSLPLWDGVSARQGLKNLLGRYDRVLAIEDHLRAGGFVSFLQECVTDAPDSMARISGISLDPIVCGQVGAQQQLNALGGLSVPGLREAMLVGEQQKRYTAWHAGFRPSS